jgi:hypothetical protein
MPRAFSVAALTLTIGLLAGCEASPTAPTTWSSDRLREQLLFSNLNHTVFGSPGRITRWRSPIAVSTGGLARVEAALAHYEEWTGGVVRFVRVTEPPVNGLIFVEGGAGGDEATAACGRVGEAQPGGTVVAPFVWDASRAIIGSYTIFLGADECDDETAGSYPSAVAEHLLAHALGVISHFDGFQHRTGLDDPRLLAFITNLYANPVGTSVAELTVWGVR